LSIGHRACTVRRVSAQPIFHKFTASQGIAFALAAETLGFGIAGEIARFVHLRESQEYGMDRSRPGLRPLVAKRQERVS
jgi:hypothetical protein